MKHHDAGIYPDSCYALFINSGAVGVAQEASALPCNMM